MAGGAWQRWTATGAATPPRLALVDGSDRLTFADLVGRSARIARVLADQARGAEHVVVLADGPAALEAVGGVLAAGAAPVVVDERVSADELHRVVDRTDATVVLHRPGTAPDVRRALRRIQRPWRPLTIDLATASGVTPSSPDPAAAVGAGSVVLVAPAPGSDQPVGRIDTTELPDVHAGDGLHLLLTPLARRQGLVVALATLAAEHPLLLPEPGWALADVLAAVEREHVTRVTVGEHQREWGHAIADAHRDVAVVVSRADADADGPTAGAPDTRRTVDVGSGVVDLERVEARIASHRGVDTCRVVELATRSGPPALVGLVVTADGHYLDAAELRAWARHKLAAHESPRAWLFVDASDAAASDAELRTLVLARLRPV